MKKTDFLRIALCIGLLTGASPMAYAEYADDVTTGQVNIDESFTGADLSKYLSSQSYHTDTPELGKALKEKFGGAWSGALIGATVQFEDGTEKSVFDKKYEELSQQAAALQKNGTMDPSERDKLLGQAWKQLDAYGAADAYSKQKLAISASYGIPMAEIDKLVKNLDTSGNSLYGYYGTPGSSSLLNEIIGAAQTYDKLESAFKAAGMDANSASGKLLQNNSMISLQTNAMYALGINTVYQAGQWTEAAVQKQIQDKLEYMKSVGIPENLWQDVINGTILNSGHLKSNSANYSALYGQLENLFGDTMGNITDQYDDLKAQLDLEYLDMKDKVAQGLASQADLDALMASQSDILSDYTDQLDLAEMNFDTIQTDMMDTLASKGYSSSGFFSGSTDFSGGSNLSSFLGGSGKTGSLFSSGGGSGGSMWQGSGGSGAAPWVLH